MERQLTDFQIKCEKKLINSLSGVGLSISGRSLDGKAETYITGTVTGTNIIFWIYQDGADFKSPNASPVFEKPDYDSLDDLAEAFVTSILKSVK